MEQVCWTLGCNWTYVDFLLETGCLDWPRDVVKDSRICSYFFLNSVYYVGLNGFRSNYQERCKCFLFFKLKNGWGWFVILCIQRWRLLHWEVSRYGILCILSRDCKAESQANRGMGVAYDITYRIKVLYSIIGVRCWVRSSDWWWTWSCWMWNLLHV